MLQSFNVSSEKDPSPLASNILSQSPIPTGHEVAAAGPTTLTPSGSRSRLALLPESVGCGALCDAEAGLELFSPCDKIHPRAGVGSSCLDPNSREQNWWG